MARLGWFAVLVVVMSAIVVTAGATQALAACNGQDENIFWQGQAFSYGNRGEIGLTNRTVDGSCVTYDVPYGSTVHVVLGSVYGNWSESGWRAHYISGGTPVISFFHESGINFTTNHNVDTYSPPCTSFGTYARYQENNVDGTYQWDGWVDCQDGQGFRYISRTPSLGYAKGLAVGETFRRGGGTGMGDVHRNLYRKDSAGSWLAWTGTSCYRDPISGWQGTSVSATRFDTVTGSGNC